MARRRWNNETVKQVQAGENPFVQFGYNPQLKKRKIGDEWVDVRGKRWKKTKNGIISVNRQADSIRELVRPRCSVCKTDLNMFGDKVDHKIFSKTGKCWSCLEAEETTMKINGQYKDYENLKIAKNQLSYLRDFRSNVVESIEYLKRDDSKLSLVSSSGELITWTGSQNLKLLKEAKQDLKEVDKLIAEVEVMISNMPVPVV